MMRTCRDCGAAFDAPNKHRRLCPACALAAKKASVVRARMCGQCGKPFQGGPRAQYCPDCRAERQRESTRLSKRAARSGKIRRPLGSTDLCAACGKPYVVVAARQRYCKDCARPMAMKADREASLARYHREKKTINPARNARRRVE